MVCTVLYTLHPTVYPGYTTHPPAPPHHRTHDVRHARRTGNVHRAQGVLKHGVGKGNLAMLVKDMVDERVVDDGSTGVIECRQIK